MRLEVIILGRGIYCLKMTQRRFGEFELTFLKREPHQMDLQCQRHDSALFDILKKIHKNNCFKKRKIVKKFYKAQTNFSDFLGLENSNRERKREIHEDQKK